MAKCAKVPTEASTLMANQMRMLSIRSGREGFTLVELLVVIGIIGVLVGLLLPALGKARRAAQQTQCLAQVREIGAMMGIYANNNRGWLFPPDAGGPFALAPLEEQWVVKVFKLTVPANEPGRSDLMSWVPKVVRCPSDAPEPEEAHSYIVNEHLIRHGMSQGSKAPSRQASSEVVVLGEKITEEPDWYVQLLPPDNTDYVQNVEHFRHGSRGSTYLFFDMHAEIRPPLPVRLPPAIDRWDPR